MHLEKCSRIVPLSSLLLVLETYLLIQVPEWWVLAHGIALIAVTITIIITIKRASQMRFQATIHTAFDF